MYGVGRIAADTGLGFEADVTLFTEGGVELRVIMSSLVRYAWGSLMSLELIELFLKPMLRR